MNEAQIGREASSTASAEPAGRTPMRDTSRVGTTGTPALIDLCGSSARLPDLAQVGAKAHSLARLHAAGFSVPRAVALAATAPLDEQTLQQLGDLLPCLGPGPYAVRSSALHEDGPACSFAGQYETVLGVKPEGLRAAIEQVRASARGLRALAYAALAGTDDASGAIAVIVQQQVDARYAGVAFTADPDSGERGVTRIEAVAGLGDRLVSGEADPEAWTVRGGRAELTRAARSPLLGEVEARQIAATCEAIERSFGEPMDVEWALAGGSLHLLQARPITHLPAPPVALPIEVPDGDWDREDHHAVLSPLGWAWLQPYMDGMGDAMRAASMPISSMELRQVGGRVYTRMLMEGGDAVPPRFVLWLASRLMPSLRRANRYAEQFVVGEGFLDAHREWVEKTRPAFEADLQALDLPDPSGLSDAELLQRIDAAMQLCARGLKLHAHLHMPGFFGIGRLGLLVNDELGWSMNRALDLVAGASPSTTGKNEALARLLEDHRAEVDAAGGLPQSWPALLRACPNLGRALGIWLKANRLHMQHYEPASPTLGEQPGHLLAVLHGLRHHRQDLDQARQQAEALAAEARAALREDRRAAFDRTLAGARQVAGLRDENGMILVSLPAGLLRHFVRELGRRLPALARPEHAVYLSPAEHGPALRGELKGLAELVQRRRGEEIWARRQTWPRRYGKPKPPMPDATAFPPALCAMMRILGWLDEAEALPEPSSDEHALRGVGIGSRAVRGRVRVLQSPAELQALRPGEIAVCRITSPEWTLGLGRMAALITDEGGALSHPAIIARELGIPEVLGTEHATRRLRTGDMVAIDPVGGRVQRLQGQT